MTGKQEQKDGPTDRDPVRILHLSDFHFCPAREWDADPVTRGLAQTIRQLVGDGLAPDIVALTGDIADKGRPEDYDQARRWIVDDLRPALPPGLPGRNLLIVPGNHDVERSKVNRTAKVLQADLLQAEDQNVVAEILDDAAQRDILLQRHRNYMDFVASLRTSDDPIAVPWWSDTLEVRGRKVQLAGLCSSWMSSSDKDYGNLLVGRWQVNRVLEGADQSDWSVTLGHHPWSWLAPFDGEELEAEVQRRCHLILRGHLHKQQTRAVQHANHKQACLELTAGSAYLGSDWPNAFQLAELHSDPRKVIVRFWLWKDGAWIVDRNACPEAADGSAEFVLDAPPRTSAEPVPVKPTDTRKYLRDLRDRTGHIEIRGVQVGSGKAHRFPIEDLYIPLLTAGGAELTHAKETAKEEEAQLGSEREARTGLDEAIRDRCVVIVGDPGAGKTTFLHRVTSSLCRAQLDERAGADSAPLPLDGDPFPILIKVAELVEHIETSRAKKDGPNLADSPAWLAHFLAATCADCGAGLGEAFFRDRLENGPTVVLLDGLDETPTQTQRDLFVGLVQKAAHEAFENCRFVLTSRPAAVEDQPVLPDFTHVRIAPLETDAIETFLARWCAALFPESSTRRQGHLHELQEALASRLEIRRSARNPLMLTALAAIHWNDKHLPEQRADLYDSIIVSLARARARPGRPPAERCVALHQELALAMQDHPDGRQVQVPRFWAAQQIAGEWREEEEPRRVAVAEAFLDQEELDSGIVVRRGDHVRFWHLTFQEYLAARALAADDKRRQRLLEDPRKLYLPEWREVLLLLAGVLEHQGRKRVDDLFSVVLAQLGEKASLADRARCFGLLGAAVQDLSPVKYKPQHPAYEKLADAVMGIFDPERSKTVKINDAIEAAEALGMAGDPRFARQNRQNNWVSIPAGAFLMGAQKTDAKSPNYDSWAFDREQPVHKVGLRTYHIGKYQVTVLEYQRFVDDDGYVKQEYWKAGGFSDRRQPDNWDEQLACLNRPVTRVSWYEAAAYAAWAGCRLPSEAEWEHAARGADGRKYPWGDEDPDTTRGNYSEGKVRHPTPVGVYPQGATPEGVLDMAGNVWEWCQDLWHHDYEGAPADGSAWASGGEEAKRVLRGGCWGDVARFCCSAARVGVRSDVRFDVIGFRVASGT